MQDIVRQIRGAALPFLGSDATSKDAREASQQASQAHTLNREEIMVALAELSMQGQWSAGDVKTAARTAAGLSTRVESEKALATFIGEASKAMLPKVRSHVPNLVHVRDLAWEAEKLAYAEDKDSPTPLRKAFSRGYHCLMQMMVLAENGRVIENVSELMEWAAERDPDLDIEKVKKRLKSIRDTLAAFYSDWPVDDIQVCMQALDEVSEGSLKASRAGIASAAEARMQAHPLRDLPKPTLVEDTSEEPEAEDAPEETTSDILEDILAA